MLASGDDYTSLSLKSGEGPKLFSLALWVDRRDLQENGGFSTAFCIKKVLEGIEREHKRKRTRFEVLK